MRYNLEGTKSPPVPTACRTLACVGAAVHGHCNRATTMQLCSSKCCAECSNNQSISQRCCAAQAAVCVTQAPTQLAVDVCPAEQDACTPNAVFYCQRHAFLCRKPPHGNELHLPLYTTTVEHTSYTSEPMRLRRLRHEGSPMRAKVPPARCVCWLDATAEWSDTA